MKRLVIVIAICAIAGAVSYNYFGEMGEWLSNWFVVPPVLLMLRLVKEEESRSKVATRGQKTKPTAS